MKLNRALGCVVGAFLGDSIGSFCEFQKQPSPQTVEKAIQMNGGGTFNLVAGQVTDDSELALCLSKGLVESQGQLNLNKICKYYCKWINSYPFDCGATIGSAFYPLHNIKFADDIDIQEPTLAQQVIEAAQWNNQESLSNGCLMRISPLIIFCLDMNYKDIIQCVRQEVRLTHPNIIAQDACVAYVLANIELINTGNAQYAFYVAKKFIYEISGIKELKQWWENIIEKDVLMSGTPQMGFLKIALTQSFVQLNKMKNSQYHKNIFKNVLAEVITQGGDTDTNACIVGAMVGAYLGLDKLPEDYVDKFNKCDPTISKRARELFFKPSNIIDDVNEMFKCLPKQLTVKPEELKIINKEN